MTEAVLEDGQYEVDGLLLGEGTPYRVLSYEDAGLAEKIVQDTKREGGDGVTHGRDYFAGFVPTWSFMVETAPGAASFDTIGELLRVWRGDAVRLTPQAQQVFRMKRAGRETVRLYGRGRRCTPVRSRRTGVGVVPVEADASCSDDRYYADVVDTVMVGITAGQGGGLVWPAAGIVFPFTTVAGSQQSSTIENRGDTDTWPVVTFEGPITRPGFTLLDDDGGVLFQLVTNVTLLTGQKLTFDYQPWARTVLRENGAAMPGARSRLSTRSDECKIPPGVHPFVFSGTDATGTATATVSCRAAYASY